MRIALLSLILIIGLTIMSCDGTTSPTAPGSADEALARPAATSPALKSTRAREPGRVSGGGHIRDGDWDISLAGQARVMGGEPVPIWSNGIQFDNVAGHWVFQFYHVSASPLDGATFKATVQRLQFVPVEGAGCVGRARIHLEGTVNRSPGWTALLIVVGGSNGNGDTVKLRLWDPAGKEYSTQQDFSNESTCAGEDMTFLDTGNLKVRWPG